MDPTILQQHYANLFQQWATGNNIHCDAAESMVFARELLRVRAELIETNKLPDLKATRLMSRRNDVTETDESFTFRVRRLYGTTSTGSDYSQNAPRSNVDYLEMPAQRIRPITSSYGWSFFEAQRAAVLGRPLPTDLAQAAREAIALRVDHLLSLGGDQGGVTFVGMLNQTTQSSPGDTGVLVYTVPNGGSGSPLWSAKTPDEILKDLFGMGSLATTNSEDIEHTDSLLIPLASHELISSVRLGDGSDTTILKHFLATSPHVKRVEAWGRLDAKAANPWGNSNRAMAYDARPTTLEYVLPVEFRQHAAQLQGFESSTPCDARIGGVSVYRPKAVVYATGF